MSKQIFYLLFAVFIQGFLQAKDDVLVSVAPHQFFVEKIAGETLKTGLMVPTGSSSHTYEPTPKQMLAASQARLWFRIGESFEKKAIQAMQTYNKELVVVDLRQGLPLIQGSCSHCCDAMDLHFWLSPRLAKIQATTIAEALIKYYPQYREIYTKNLKCFHDELDQLDKQITSLLEFAPNKTILVSHPAYSYFCRDYGLIQYSIECEGRDPTPQQLNKILQLAKSAQIKTIFIQSQYPSKGARLVADQIGAKLVNLDPYSPEYTKSLFEIAQEFARGSQAL